MLDWYGRTYQSGMIVSPEAIPGSYLLRTRQKSAFGPIPVQYQNPDKYESVNIDPIPVLNWSVKRDIQPVLYVRLETMHWCRIRVQIFLVGACHNV
jgi:hypothetical protein